MAGTNNSHNLHISLSQCISIRAHFVLYHPIITFNLVNIVFWPPIPYSAPAEPPSPVQPREVLPKEHGSHCPGTLYKASRQLFRISSSLFSQNIIGKKGIKTSTANLPNGGVHRPAATVGGGECSLPTTFAPRHRLSTLYLPHTINLSFKSLCYVYILHTGRPS